MSKKQAITKDTNKKKSKDATKKNHPMKEKLPRDNRKLELESCRILLKNLPQSVKESDVLNACKEAKVAPSDFKLDTKKRIAFLGFDNEDIADRALVALNQSYILNCCITAQKCYKLRPPTEEKTDETRTGIMDTGRLFVRNLHYTVTEEDFRELFEPFGDIEEVNLCWDKHEQRNKGFGFVSYVFPTDAVKAYEKLDRSTLKGRFLHICAAKDKPEDTRPKSFKEEKEDKLKKESSKGHNWNMLFLGADAVAEVMSSQLGVSKADLLKTDTGKDKKSSSTSIAVNQAMGETVLVQQTKDYLEQAGVKLNIIETHCKKPVNQRSTTTFLVKNLPPGTTAVKLRERFEPYGAMKRIVLPPYGITAVVEFAVPQEAKTAYKKQAYSRIKDRPLLLEWAPENLIDSSAPLTMPEKEEEEVVEEEEELVEEVEEVEEETKEQEEKEEEEESGQKHKLSVKNIAFQATKRELIDLFKPFGDCRVRLPIKAGGTTEDGQHRGFCFVEYATAKSAQKAMSQLGVSTHFYGRRLVIQRALGESDDPPANRKRQARAALEAELVAKQPTVSGKKLREAVREHSEQMGAV